MQCNDIYLRSGRIVEPIIDDITDSDKNETKKQKEAQPPPNKNVELTKTAETPAFNFMGELQNLYIKIPL